MGEETAKLPPANDYCPRVCADKDPDHIRGTFCDSCPVVVEHKKFEQMVDDELKEAQIEKWSRYSLLADYLFGISLMGTQYKEEGYDPKWTTDEVELVELIREERRHQKHLYEWQAKKELERLANK